MNQELKEKIHYYLPHGVRFQAEYLTKDRSTNEPLSVRLKDRTLIGMDTKKIMLDGGRFQAKLTPKMRPLSSLTKEITVPGYNDGKPFVPNKIIKKISTNPEYYESHVHPYLIFTYLITKGNNHLPFWVCELLFQWHFWIGDQALFDTGEIIKIEG